MGKFNGRNRLAVGPMPAADLPRVGAGLLFVWVKRVDVAVNVQALPLPLDDADCTQSSVVASEGLAANIDGDSLAFAALESEQIALKRIDGHKLPVPKLASHRQKANGLIDPD